MGARRWSQPGREAARRAARRPETPDAPRVFAPQAVTVPAGERRAVDCRGARRVTVELLGAERCELAWQEEVQTSAAAGTATLTRTRPKLKVQGRFLEVMAIGGPVRVTPLR